MQVVSGLLELDVPLILDADALNCLAKIAIDGIDSNPEMYRREQPLVMTPHYRELSRLVAGDEVNDLGTAIAARAEGCLGCRLRQPGCHCQGADDGYLWR